MIGPIMPGVACLVLGACLGAGAVLARLRGRLAADARAIATLRAELEAAEAAQVPVAALRAQLSSLRHDLRGILSPALLIADRLVGSPHPSIRRAGDVVIRTVERATARLAEAAPGASDAVSPTGAIKTPD